MTDYTKAVTYFDAHDENTLLEFQETWGNGNLLISVRHPEGLDGIQAEVTLNHAQLLDLRARIDAIVNKLNTNLGQPGSIMERNA
jgi:hypothetical protein